MRKGRFSEQQIIGILKRHEAGQKVADLAREHGVSEATIYTWKSRYGGLEVNEAQRLKSLEEENHRLKHLVADLLTGPAGRGRSARAIRSSSQDKWCPECFHACNAC